MMVEMSSVVKSSTNGKNDVGRLRVAKTKGERREGSVSFHTKGNTPDKVGNCWKIYGNIIKSVGKQYENCGNVLATWWKGVGKVVGKCWKSKWKSGGNVLGK